MINRIRKSNHFTVIEMIRLTALTECRLCQSYAKSKVTPEYKDPDGSRIQASKESTKKWALNPKNSWNFSYLQ